MNSGPLVDCGITGRHKHTVTATDCSQGKLSPLNSLNNICSQRPFLDLPRGAPGPWALATPTKSYTLLLTKQPAYNPAASLGSGPPSSHSYPGSGFSTLASSPRASILFHLFQQCLIPFLFLGTLGSDNCHTSFALVSHSKHRTKTCSH